jgi:hypothetical protein
MPDAGMSERLRCRHCGEVIGVYEPLVRVGEDRAAESSRALDPLLSDLDVELYHRACFERLGETQTPGG